MQKNKIIITLGIIIATMPILGFPRAWESFFQVAIGVGIVLICVWSNIDKKITVRAKAQRRQHHRRQMDLLEEEKALQVDGIQAPEPVIQEESL